MKAISEFNEFKNETDPSFNWEIRKDDFFPYAMYKDSFWTGYYTSRPNMKKNIRDFTKIFHSGQRLLAEQLLRRDFKASEINDLLTYQFNTLDVLGNL